MEQLTFKPKSITTPVGVEANGKELDVEVRFIHILSYFLEV